MKNDTILLLLGAVVVGYLLLVSKGNAPGGSTPGGNTAPVDNVIWHPAPNSNEQPFVHVHGGWQNTYPGS